jgi:hypothetical protein
MQVGEVEAQEALKANEEAIEAFESSESPRTITFQFPDAGDNMHPVTFIQAPLGHFPAQEFITMMTRLINDVLEGKYDVDVMQLLRDRERLQRASMPSNLEEDVAERMIEEWKPYIQGFLKLVHIIPELQQDIIALSLGVRRKQREEFKEAISEAPYRGGIEIDDAVDILKVFIKQNVRVLRRFLAEQIPEIFEEAMKALEVKKEESTTGGTQSNTSSPPTPESA